MSACQADVLTKLDDRPELSYINGCPMLVMSTFQVLVACMIDLLLNGFRRIYALSVGWVSMGASLLGMA